jgi:hypothetical protein
MDGIVAQIGTRMGHQTIFWLARPLENHVLLVFMLTFGLGRLVGFDPVMGRKNQ